MRREGNELDLSSSNFSFTDANESGPFPQLGDDFPYVEGLGEKGGRIALYAT